MSNKGTIIHLDNDEDKLSEFRSLFEQKDIDLELISCSNKEEFNKALEKNPKSIRSLVFDLLGPEVGADELLGEETEFLEEIKKSLHEASVPIFIYSGYLPKIDGKYEDHGTIFKVDKADGPDKIFDSLKLFYESGFLEVFCPGGKIEQDLHKELNRAFISQFTNDSQIEKIIQVVDEGSEEENKKRIERIFKRIAIRSLLTSLNNPVEDGLEFMHPVEHYLQRISSFELWTGDILINDDGEMLLVITPRCNVSRADEILVCEIREHDFSTDEKNVQRALRDNPILSGYDRILPPTPFFKGGKIKPSAYKIIDRELLINNYDVIVSLSDELTNEMLGKFGSYFFRSGITPWHENEMINHLEEG